MTTSSVEAGAPDGRLVLLSALTPASSSRAWLSAPHPYLPLVATCSSDRTVRIYSLTNFQQHSQIEGGHKRSIRSCAWKPTGDIRGESVLATGSFDASAGIWRRWDDNELLSRSELADDEGEDDSDWRFAVILEGHESEVKSVAWNSSGQYLATCSRDKSVWIWEEVDEGDNTFETIAVLQEHDGDVKCVVWHPEEELLASASYDDTIRLYREDIDDWLCVAVLRGHTSTVWALDFEGLNRPSPFLADERLTPSQAKDLDTRSRAGPRLVSCSDDRTIRIWRRVPPASSSTIAVTHTSGHIHAPSILRTHSAEQEWTEESQLPALHDRAIYSVAWSKRTGNPFEN